MAKTVSKIEPPVVIRTEREGINAIATLVELVKKAPANRLLGMLYLKFNNEEEVDKWIAKMKLVLNHYWKEKLKHTTDLTYICVSKENMRDEVDIIFAEDPVMANLGARLRFPGSFISV
jgi:hypothetical protein